MKQFHLNVLIALLVFTGCQQQLSVCESVKKTSDLPWLDELVQFHSAAEGPDIQSVEKITYSIPESNTTYVGFYVVIGTEPRTIENVYDCDGNLITQYGGVQACTGQCDIVILSRTTIYESK